MIVVCVTHIGVGVLRLCFGQRGVTVGAVVLTEVISSLRVGGDQQLLDVSLSAGKKHCKVQRQVIQSPKEWVKGITTAIQDQIRPPQRNSVPPVLTWKTSSSSRRAPNTVMPLVSISALLLRGRGRVVFFLQSSSRVTFFLETERAMRCHLEHEKHGKGRTKEIKNLNFQI